MTLDKVVRLGNVQVCTFKKSLVFFYRLNSGVWEQRQASENVLVYHIPDDPNTIAFVQDFLDSNSKSVILKKLKRGCYTIK